MPDLAMLVAFISACIVLGLIPGPNAALIISNSVAYGSRYGLMTVAGTLSAMVPQLILTCLGMTALLAGLSSWFSVLRWVGVVYLLWLGISHWRAAPTDLTKTAALPRSARGLLLRSFLVSIANPKTLLFYSAFFPQFVDATRPLAPQLVILSVLCLVVLALVDSAWALLAARARRYLAINGRLRNRLTGGLLIGAGAGLAAAHRS